MSLAPLEVIDSSGKRVPIYIQYELLEASDMVSCVVRFAKERITSLDETVFQVNISYVKDPVESTEHANQEVVWIEYLDCDADPIDRDYIDWATGHMVCKACLGTGRVRRPGSTRPPWSLCPDCSGRGRSLRPVTRRWTCPATGTDEEKR